MAVAPERRRTEIRVEGVFDVAAARRVATFLDCARYVEVRIDMTRVREFHDFGVAILVQAIAERSEPTAVMGLHEHHLRLVRHLGIDCNGADLSAGVDLG